MALLCGRCVRAIRSRGEKIYVGDLIDYGEPKSCMWCEETEDELFAVAFEIVQYTDSGTGAEYEEFAR